MVKVIKGNLKKLMDKNLEKEIIKKEKIMEIMAMETETVMETVNIKEMNKQKLQNQMTLEFLSFFKLVCLLHFVQVVEFV